MKRETRDRGRTDLAPEKYVEDSDPEPEDEGETRCICGKIEPPDDSGLYIQCEQCHVWQHGYCVGISEEETPDKYWCEQCKPELHSLYTTDLGEKRSIYKPIQQRRRKNRRSKRNSESDGEVSNAGSSLENQSPSSSVVSGNIGSQRLSRQRRNSSNVELSKDEGEDSIADSGNGEDKDENIPKREFDPIDENQKVADRKRATSSAREEKHYQLMLEKALRESRRSSKDGTDPEDQDILKEEEASGKSASPKNYTRDTESPEVEGSEADEAASQSRKRARTTTKSTSPSGSEDDSKSKRSRRGKSNGSTTQSNSRIYKTSSGRVARNSKASSSKGSGSSGSSNLSKSNGQSNDIGINKPLKPRIPSQRTTMHEMRRRVNAILEFISRTQLEISNDQRQRDQLCQFVENEEFLENINKIFSSYDESFKTMDELTRKLLLWEQKFSPAS
ncbi:Cti6p [Kluyveromyces lactis]|uniref:KLLA0E18811p n=1 Tax=Kluyveromyces lactis (strain ATCC 8585 / CBS 2359 / DSM 70799 / NBRC 1267 / NRRL Y-1140 / WM37) TaxID=284590 RepID=Q6CMN8_KLULA|nr:uncharacterized protein KLLA0_E18811g [Kluyveromyces lactis]CAG99888.1 KLLA0E18811p [Kluyveromyces lactis]|eukprot:XP_454801.1 uncharacterized protein KLLA0_E18811g [Kluyveromyces lactis]